MDGFCFAVISKLGPRLCLKFILVLFKIAVSTRNFECAVPVADFSSNLLFIGMFRSANTAMRITWRREAIMMLLATRHSIRRFSVSTVGPATPSQTCKLTYLISPNQVFVSADVLRRLRALDSLRSRVATKYRYQI